MTGVTAPAALKNRGQLPQLAPAASEVGWNRMEKGRPGKLGVGF